MPNFGTSPNQSVIQDGLAICHRLVVIPSLLDCQLTFVYYNARMERRKFGRIHSKGDTSLILLRVDAKHGMNDAGWSYLRNDTERYVFLGNRPFQDMFDVLLDLEGDIVETSLYETH